MPSPKPDPFLSKQCSVEIQCNLTWTDTNTVLASVKQTITINPVFFLQSRMAVLKRTDGSHCASISTNIP